ncbi:MAG: hypothetical protein J0M02_19595 [Planctomycetes bacterium]|nr:hypothetical protein [Planctomycetota bacterium]
MRRTLVLARGDGAVRLADTVAAGRTIDYVLPLLSPARPQPDGERAWIVASGGQRLRIIADAPLSGSLAEVELDGTLRRSWGSLWRLTLRGRLADGAAAGVAFLPA